ncbi:MAG: RlmE family RNA methyltransferase [Candidatus Binataceae bacterium]
MANYQPRDKYFKRAREQGLPSRAAFKLSELLERYRLIRPRMRVLDLGCAPGGWLAIIARMVSDDAKVVGVDLVACPAPSPKVAVLTGDMAEPTVRRTALTLLGGPADLIISDMAPKLSGIKTRDAARCEELLGLALQTASEMLKPGGAMIAKAFMGEGFTQTVVKMRARFRTVDIVRTNATRPGSRELYLVARDFRPAAE